MSDLDWVTGEQQRELDDLVAERGDWRVWLPELLDEQWPDWTAAEPATRTAWLLDWLPTLLGQGSQAEDYDYPGAEDQAVQPEAVEQSTVDVRDLGWVTAEQRTRLAAVPEAGAEWPAWLTGKLDELWPEWVGSTPEVLVPWLDEWMPTLAAGGQDAPGLAQTPPETGAEDPPTPEGIESALADALREAVERQEIDPEVLALIEDEPELQEYFAAQLRQYATQEVSS
jgi:hypothetical protein